VNTGWDFLSKFRLTLEGEMNNIKKDILEQFPHDKREAVFLPRPSIDDCNKQAKIDKLVEMRSNNRIVLERILNLLQTSEFIICENCKGKMIKTPVGVKYERMGNNFVILDKDTNCKWVYMCENCVFAISKEIYFFKKRNLEMRKELIESGITFVPNEFGVWNTLAGKPCIKCKELRCEEVRAKRRVFETINIEGVKNPFVKIVEEYPDTGEKVLLS
jgi:hypothetical protein